MDHIESYTLQRRLKLDSLKLSLETIDLLNLTYSKLTGVKFVICDTNNPSVRSRIIEIQKKAYEDSGYGERAEGEEMFEHEFRGLSSENHGRIFYIGIIFQNKIIAYFSFFESSRLLFDENLDLPDLSIQLEDLPIIVFSKLARDPNFKKILFRKGLPHRIALITLLIKLAEKSNQGFLLETRAQPDTQRMLREENMNKYFPGYKILLEQDSEGEFVDKPKKLLLYFPKLNIKSFITTARNLIQENLLKALSSRNES